MPASAAISRDPSPAFARRAGAESPAPKTWTTVWASAGMEPPALTWSTTTSAPVPRATRVAIARRISTSVPHHPAGMAVNVWTWWASSTASVHWATRVLSARRPRRTALHRPACRATASTRPRVTTATVLQIAPENTASNCVRSAPSRPATVSKNRMAQTSERPWEPISPR